MRIRPLLRLARGVPPLLLLALSLLATGCREGAFPYEVPGRAAPEGGTWRLTWGQGQDRNPVWSAGSDTIYFHTTFWRELGGASGGVLLRIPRDGGAASPLAPDAQPGGLTPLLTPVPSADGSRLAYVQLLRLNPPAACLEGFEEPRDVIWVCEAPEPRLDTAVVRVRAVTSNQPAGTDPGVRVHYAGADPRRTAGLPPPYYQRVYPFQFEWVKSQDASSLRPALSSDGQQVVFSDGLQLHSWRAGQSAPVPIPNTQDGVAPAWSPDGQWLAFTVNERTDSTQYQCACSEGNQASRHWRWGYTTRQRIAIVRPDGSGRRVLTDGHEAAWAPGSDRIYFSFDRQIHSIALSGGAATAVPETLDGRMPAVSPDGRWLAFARRKSFFEDYDLWVTRLQDGS